MNDGIERLLLIYGSLRASSSSASLARAAAALAPVGVHAEVYEELERIPMFSPDLDGDDCPDAVERLRASLSQVDAVILCTPEYAFGMPGVLKNALDWLVSSGSLYEKPVAAWSSSPSGEGGQRALAWLRETLAAHHAHVVDAASFPIPHVRLNLNADGTLSAELTARLTTALSILNAAVRQRRSRAES